MENETIGRAEIAMMKKECNESHGDHESRIRLLEATKWQIVGMAVAGSVLVGLIGNELTKRLFG